MREDRFVGTAKHARQVVSAVHAEIVRRLSPQRVGDMVDNLMASASAGNHKAAELVLKLSGVLDFDPDKLESHLVEVTDYPTLNQLSFEEAEEIRQSIRPPAKAKGSRRI
jgi:hypothetical protein